LIRLLYAALVVLLLGSAASAQELAGAWQGTLNAGKPLRLVFVVTGAADSGFTATAHSIDQGGQALAETDKYDITAVPRADGQPNERQLREMLRRLLTHRFQLTFHREQQNLPVSATSSATAARSSRRTRRTRTGCRACCSVGSACCRRST